MTRGTATTSAGVACVSLVASFFVLVLAQQPKSQGGYTYASEVFSVEHSLVVLFILFSAGCVHHHYTKTCICALRSQTAASLYACHNPPIRTTCSCTKGLVGWLVYAPSPFFTPPLRSLPSPPCPARIRPPVPHHTPKLPRKTTAPTDSGAAYGTAKAGMGIGAMGVMHPELVMRNIIPVVMAGVLGIYGLIVSVILLGQSEIR